MNTIEVSWIREGETFTHVGDGVEALTGWSAEEATSKPIKELVTPSTLKYIKENYYAGPPDSIVPRAFPVWLVHRDGHEACCRIAVVCRYDGEGKLAEAWGCLTCHRGQCIQNDLLERWPRFEDGTLAILGRLAEAWA